jgi:hypothetical protein
MSQRDGFSNPAWAEDGERFSLFHFEGNAIQNLPLAKRLVHVDEFYENGHTPIVDF